jgi:hypothetical protein
MARLLERARGRGTVVVYAGEAHAAAYRSFLAGRLGAPSVACDVGRGVPRVASEVRRCVSLAGCASALRQENLARRPRGSHRSQAAASLDDDRP